MLLAICTEILMGEEHFIFLYKYTRNDNKILNQINQGRNYFIIKQLF